MEEVLAIKPDICFLWDEAWYAFAVAVPWVRRRTAMVAAQHLEEKLVDPRYRAEYFQWKAEMAGVPRAEWATKRLLPDPDLARVRVHATHSTH
jgi:arginine decarboxylase